MEQPSTDLAAPSQGEVKSLESSLKTLWDKAKRAAEVIGELRDQKRLLETRVGQLEVELRQLQAELAKKDQLAKTMAANLKAVDPKRAVLFANGERETLAVRVRDLLAKIDAYL